MTLVARLVLLFCLCVWPLAASAAPVSPQIALAAATAWLGLPERALAPATAGPTGSVTAQADTDGTTLFYTVALAPAGFVLVAGDDTMEPILAFSGSGAYDGDPASPLYFLATTDAADRLAAGRTRGTSAGQAAEDKWRLLLDGAENRGAAARQHRDTVSTVRVAPFLQTKWGQSNDKDDQPLYNLYTPKTTGGQNTLTGCVATAMAQVMRFFEFPTRGVGTTARPVKLCQSCSGSAPQQCGEMQMATRGGDGQGGAYDFAAMPLAPGTSTPDAARQAISALMADAGATVQMDYSTCVSGAYQWFAASALTDVFGFSNAVWNSGGPTAAYSMSAEQYRNAINTNLDAGLPVMLTISNSSAGHEVVADGYGYEDATPYYHCNMGWDGLWDVWYNLPVIDPEGSPFTTVWTIIYNIYTTGGGEVVSGRVSDKDGQAIADVAVTITNQRDTKDALTVKTNANGLFAFSKLASNTAFALTAAKAGWSFPPQYATTGVSLSPTGDNQGNITNYGLNLCGNFWGADFTGLAVPIPIPPVYLILGP